MLTAVQDGQRITPRSGGRGTCPGCGGAVLAKCGRIVTWHWAHVTGEDCDPWAEPDSAWHRGWQERYPIEQREVVIGDHRADVVTADGEVLEFQHSYLSPDEIAAREAFYGRAMWWVFDATEAAAEDRLSLRRALGNGVITFRWKYPRKSVGVCRRPVLLDLGARGLLMLGRLYLDSPPYGGWGWLHTREEFLSLTGARDRAPRAATVESGQAPHSARICSRILTSRQVDGTATVDELRNLARQARDAGLWDEQMRSRFTARRLRIEAGR